MNYPQQSHPNAPPPRKKTSGCLVAAAIVGGVLLLGGVGLAFVVWRVASSEQGRKIVSAVSSGAQIAAEAGRAPGTAELRALGCEQAAVIDARRLQELAAQFVDAGELHVNDARLLVTCQAKRSGTAPTCDHVAQTYVAAVGGRAAGSFQVDVSQSGHDKSVCGQAYAADGTRTR